MYTAKKQIFAERRLPASSDTAGYIAREQRGWEFSSELSALMNSGGDLITEEFMPAPADFAHRVLRRYGISRDHVDFEAFEFLTFHGAVHIPLSLVFNQPGLDSIGIENPTWCQLPFTQVAMLDVIHGCSGLSDGVIYKLGESWMRYLSLTGLAEWSSGFPDSSESEVTHRYRSIGRQKDLSLERRTIQSVEFFKVAQIDSGIGEHLAFEFERWAAIAYCTYGRLFI